MDRMVEQVCEEVLIINLGSAITSVFRFLAQHLWTVIKDKQWRYWAVNVIDSHGRNVLRIVWAKCSPSITAHILNTSVTYLHFIPFVKKTSTIFLDKISNFLYRFAPLTFYGFFYHAQKPKRQYHFRSKLKISQIIWATNNSVLYLKNCSKMRKLK